MRVLSLLAVMLLAWQGVQAQPSGAAGIALRFDREVLRVSMPWPGTLHRLADLARAGGVALRWRIAIERLRPWWMPDTEIGEIEITRTLMPDLLAGGWRIVESPSGVLWHEDTLREALMRLANLVAFPVLDRALLESGVHYRMRVEIEVHAGEAPSGWWTRLWVSPAFTTTVEFRAP